MANTKITTDALADGAITSAKLGSGAVNTQVASYLSSNSFVDTTALNSAVSTAVSNLVGSAPSTLDTLEELATSIGNSATLSSTLTSSIATKLPLAGGTLTGDLILGDSIKLELGAGTGGDLQLYHDGSHSYVTNTYASGALKLVSDDFRIENASNRNQLKTGVSGAVQLFFDDGSATGLRLGTTAAGVDVTGNIVVSGTVDGVDIAARDAVLTSTTTTAGAALPKAGGTMTGNLAINTGSPELYFGTTGNHYNWRIAAQELVDAGFEIAVGSQDTDYSNDTYVNKFVVKASGNVGIGTDTPDADLHISGSNDNNLIVQNSTYQNSGQNTEAAIRFKVTASSDDERAKAGILLKNDGSAYGRGDLHFLVDSNDDNGNAVLADSKMVISHEGNVGIGTGSPDEKLHVAGQASFEGAGNTNRGNIIIGAHGNGTAKWSTLGGTHYNDATGSGSGTGDAGCMIIGNYSDASNNRIYIGGGPYELNPATEIRFNTHSSNLHNLGGSLRMVITSAGNVGIGTASPSYKTHIKGTTAFNTTYNSYSNDLFIENSASGAGAGNFGGSIGLSGSGTEQTNKRVVLAAVQTGSDQDQCGFSIFTHPSQYGSNPIVEALRITHDGNVGIGTDDPDCALDVTRTTGWAEMHLDGASGGDLILKDNGVNIGEIYAGVGHGMVLKSYASQHMSFLTGGNATAKMTLDTSGRLAINQTPLANNFALQVTGLGGASNDARAVYLKGSGNHTSIGSTGPTLVLQNTNSTANNIVKLSFESASSGETVSINAINTNHSSHYGDMAFNTRGSAGYSEKLRITSNGEIRVQNQTLVDSANTNHIMIFPNNKGISIGTAYTYGEFNANNGNVHIRANSYPANTGSESLIYLQTANSSGGQSSDVVVKGGKVGIRTDSPTLPLDIMPDSSKRVFGSQQNQTQHGFCEYIISGTIGAGAVTITMQCPSYFQAEVIATFQQSNGGSDNNAYFNGIWSNNHTTHLFKNKTNGGTVPRIGSLGNATPAFTVGVGDAASNSGKLVFTKPAATNTSGTYCIRVIAYGYSNASMTYVVS